MSTMPLAADQTVYRIETPRLVVRCYELRDEALRLDAVTRSFAQVGPVLGWKEWPTRASVRAFLRKVRGEFDLDRDRIFGIFNRDETVLWGETMYLIRAGHDAREIGVWTVPETWGQGVATEGVGAIVHSGFVFEGLKRFDYACAVDNERSAGLAGRLGFVHEGVLRGRTIPSDPTPTDTLMFSMLATDFEGSAPERLALRAFDGFGDER